MEDLLAIGAENGNAELHPGKYSVVQADLSYCGEIQVGVTFTRKVCFPWYTLFMTMTFLVVYRISSKVGWPTKCHCLNHFIDKIKGLIRTL